MRRCRQKSRESFTLIELLIVLVIIGIIAGVSTPSLIRSLRNQRLHSAAYTLVTVARYARSMSILKQTDLSLIFNLDTGQIDLISSNAVLPRFTRVVADVRIAYIETEDDGQCTEGIYVIPYYHNGTCKPFKVMVRDKQDNYVIVKVDALSSVTTLKQRVD